ncbi:MAG: Na+/H+ antiporter subunit E [Opitutae bacterium]
MYQLLTFILLLVNWIIFSGVLDAFHLGLGVICCGFVAWLSTDLVFGNTSKGLRARLFEAFRFMGYAVWLLWQVVLANIHVLKLAFSQNERATHPRIIRFKTSLKSDFARYVFANSITLTPGTVTMSLVGDEFVVHAIDKAVADELPGEMEKRVAAVFDQD